MGMRLTGLELRMAVLARASIIILEGTSFMAYLNVLLLLR
jgi:hypothetical protein